MRFRKLAIIVLVVLGSARLQAATARLGWTKVELVPASDSDTSALSAFLANYGAEIVADYGGFVIAYVPDGTVASLLAQAGTANIRARSRDELDVLELPGGAVDTRIGIGEREPPAVFEGYEAKQLGMFVIQLVAPPRPEWIVDLQALGWTLSRYIPNDGYLAIGRSELIEPTQALDYVQWVDFFHPYQKATTLAGDSAPHDYMFELPGDQASEGAVTSIQNAAESDFDVQYGTLDTFVYARMTEAAALALLQDPMILSVALKPEGELADGRQSQSLSSLVNTDQSEPTSPAPGQQNQYWDWVLSANRCGNACSSANMPASTWMIGFADSGLDNGTLAGGHPDLAGRKYFGSVILRDFVFNDPECNGTNGPFCCPVGAPLCDLVRHGTLTTSIAAGNGAGGTTDGVNSAQGFLHGLGGAPTAGIFMTKIRTRNAGLDGTLVSRWTADAAANNVTVQNHSWEETGQNVVPGTYTAISRMVDIAVRDADDAVSTDREPIMLTIAAGNDANPGDGVPVRTSGVGMAKNGLTLGGLENFRPDANSNACQGTLADSFRNIMKYSRVGNGLTGYIKPDLMAPASMIVSAMTSMYWPDPQPSRGYCLKETYTHDMRYTGDSGTSFAAPLGAAASIIVKRYLGNSPADTSPALIKATLIAGAHSVRGGEDRTKVTTPPTLIGPVPSAQQQGFGRLTLEDILNGSQKPVYVDQSTTFTRSDESLCMRVQVRDATKPVKAALVWTDAPAEIGALNPLVNDLNLEVIRATSPTTVYVGNSLAVANETNGEESVPYAAGVSMPVDHVNNVEVFRKFVSANEQLTLAVKAAAITGDTDGVTSTFEQDFALVVLNASPIGSPASCCTSLGVSTQPAATSWAQPGDTVTLNVVASGTGPFTYQWYQGGTGTTTTPVGGNSSSYTTPPLPAGVASFWVRVISGCGGTPHSFDSDTANIFVDFGPIDPNG